MRNENEKKYHIPRKVTEGFTMLGLDAKGMIIMLGFVALAALFVFTASLPTGGKVVLTTLFVLLPYFSLTQELGNGLKVTEYVRLWIDFNLLSQKDYTITSSRSRVREDEFPVLTYERQSSPLSSREVLISDYSDFDKEIENESKNQQREDREQELADLEQWIAKPKTLRRSE